MSSSDNVYGGYVHLAVEDFLISVRRVDYREEYLQVLVPFLGKPITYIEDSVQGNMFMPYPQTVEETFSVSLYTNNPSEEVLSFSAIKEGLANAVNRLLLNLIKIYRDKHPKGTMRIFLPEDAYEFSTRPQYIFISPRLGFTFRAVQECSKVNITISCKYNIDGRPQ